MARPASGDLIIVDPDGDLILKVGKEKANTNDIAAAEQGSTAQKQPTQEEAQLDDDSSDATDDDELSVDETEEILSLSIRVCSKFMTMCSPVFKTMLDGPFAEGKLPLDTTNPATLELPEDDPESMVEVCRILHHKWDLVTVDCFERSCNIAELASKYACHSIVKAWYRHHLLSKSPSWTPKCDADLAYMISASYYLEDVEAFYYFTLSAARRLKRRCNRSLPFSSACENYMPPRVYGKHKPRRADHV